MHQNLINFDAFHRSYLLIHRLLYRLAIHKLKIAIMNKLYLTVLFFCTSLVMQSQDYKEMIISGNYSVQEIQTAAEKHFEKFGTERGKGYKPYKRWEYNAIRMMDANGMLKTPDFYYGELERYNNYLNQEFGDSRTTVGNWQQLGPLSWNQTSGWNPGVGRITAFAIEPVNTGVPQHIIVGGQTGGVWRTTDGGTTWTVLTDDLSNIVVYSLAMDPTNSSIYYWGSSAGVIFKSTDSGATWNQLADIGGGNVNKILIDPSNTSKMYCSSEGGGLFKSTNSGANWTLIHPDATNGYDLEFKPSNTNTIYASGNAFFKSIDGGTTFTKFTPSSSSPPLGSWTQEYGSGSHDWTNAPGNRNNSVTPKTGIGMAYFQIDGYSAPITKLVSPSIDISGTVNPILNFSFTQADWQGDQDELKVFYRTSSAGVWTEIAHYTANTPSWQDESLALPNKSSDYYIAFEGTANYGYGITIDDISIEDGASIIYEEGFEDGAVTGFAGGPLMLGVSENATNTDAEVVYVLEAAGGIFGGFHVSTDGGDTFNKLNHGSNNYFGYSSTANDNRGQAPRDMDIVVHPDNVDEVHIAGILTWRSVNGGSSFDITSQWVPQNAAAQGIGYCHADVDIMQFVGNELYVGSDGGIFVARNTGTVNANYYEDLTNGLGIRQFYKIGISQTSPVIVTGGSQDNGTSVMDTSGNWTDWLGADGMESFVDKDNSSIMYGTSQGGTLYKTTNNGVSYFGLSSPDGKSGNWITPFEQDPITSNVIYSGYDQVYKSVNGGSSWTAISQNLGGNLNHLKIAPTNSNIMFAARGTNLFKTSDGGATNWTTLSGFSGSINSIAIHPTDPNKVAIATTASAKVYVSTNGGTTWTSYQNNLPNFSALALAWQNNGNDGLYVGMNYGVYYIDNTFTQWQPFSNSLPNVIVNELEVNEVDKKIYAGTYGRGLWASDTFDPTLSNDEFELDTIAVYPNPASNEINLKWNKNDEVTIKVFNSLGKLLFSEVGQSLSNGFKIDINNYSSGLYFVRINNVNGVLTKKVMVE